MDPNNFSLTFLGCGGAFDTELGNNSAYWVEEKAKLINLIDCGSTVFSKFKPILNSYYSRYREELNLQVYITHMHPDHVGSLGDLVFYCYYALGIKVTIISPLKKDIQHMLYSQGISTDLYDCYDEKNSKIQFCKTSHVDEIYAFYLDFYINNKHILYSGDTSTCLLSIFEYDLYDEIYHEASLNGFGVHTQFNELLECSKYLGLEDILCVMHSSLKCYVECEKQGIITAQKLMIK